MTAIRQTYKRQKWALLALLGLFAIACGKPLKSTEQKQNPLTGYVAKPGENKNPKEDITYQPNPEFEAFVEKNRKNEIPEEKAVGPKPLEIVVNEGESDSFSQVQATEDSSKEKPPVTVRQSPTTNIKIEVQDSSTPTPRSPPTRPSTPSTPPLTPPTPPKASFPSPKVDSKFQTLLTPGVSIVNSTTEAKTYCKTPEVRLSSSSQSWCFYAFGKLFNAQQLPSSGPGFYSSDYYRNYQWTTKQALEVIRWSSLKFYNSSSRNFLINTISQKNGGSIGHSSHQNGLDIDINLPKRNENLEGDIVSGGKVRNLNVALLYEALQIFNSTNRIGKFFVNPAVKSELCKYSMNTGRNPDPLQTKIATESRHENHFHVRVRCNEKSCLNQVDFRNSTECQLPGYINI